LFDKKKKKKKQSLMHQSKRKSRADNKKSAHAYNIMHCSFV
jgi:hypothetical protein